MNKEEQIKRLAQNLFSKGFTKSMDYAVQTAARMLGFPDSMLNNNLMKEEEAKFGAESILNAGQMMGANNNSTQNMLSQSAIRDEKPLHQETHDYVSRDLTKKITQSIAEDRVYSMIPGAVRDAVDTQSFDSAPAEHVVQSPEPMQAQSQPEMQSFEQSIESNMFISSQEPSFTESSFESVSEEPAIEMSSEQNLFESQSMDENIFAASENGFITSNEDTSSIEQCESSDFEPEEQTSLISGFMQGQSISEPVVQEAQPSMDMKEEIDASEDFFTPVLAQREQMNQINEQPAAPVQQPVQSNNLMFASAPAQEQPSQSQAQPETKNCAEASIDLTQMFDFRNMKN